MRPRNWQLKDWKLLVDAWYEWVALSGNGLYEPDHWRTWIRIPPEPHLEIDLDIRYIIAGCMAMERVTARQAHRMVRNYIALMNLPLTTRQVPWSEKRACSLEGNFNFKFRR